MLPYSGNRSILPAWDTSRADALGAKSSMEDVRCGPEKSESEVLAAAFAAWEAVAVDENHLGWPSA